MSNKRQATTNLNHDNWDQDDPSEQEEMGTFTCASKDVMEKRVIRTAKRRAPQASADEAKKSVFSGFGGFNKTQPSSFDFLSNLTNGNKSTNGSPASKSEATATSSLFSSKPATSSPSTGLFSIPVTSSPTPKPVFGIPSTQSSLFGGTPVNTTTTQSPFTAKTQTATVDSPPKSMFGITSTQSSLFGGTQANTTTTQSPFAAKTQTAAVDSSPKAVFGISSTQPSLFGGTAASTTTTQSSFVAKTQTAAMDSPSKAVFGIPSTQSSFFGGTPASTTTMQSPFATKTATTDGPFKLNTSLVTDSKTDTLKNSFGASSNTNKSIFSSTNTSSSPFKMSNAAETPPENSSEKISSEKNEDNKMKYWAKLKGLNESVSDWIKKHVEETPLCLLSPIFKDYERYLKEIQDEYEESKKLSEKIILNVKPNTAKMTSNAFGISTGSSPFSSTLEKPSMFSGQGNTYVSGEKSSGFSFEDKTPPDSAKTTAAGISFVNNTVTPTSNSSPFSLTNNAAGTGSNGAPFSFGLGKPFSFSSNIQSPPETASAEANNEEDVPPKVEFTPIVEENSVFDKRVKIFVKKEDNFVDNGVGTLYIKKVDNSDKHQLLVRANTSLGNIILNMILASGIPTKRLGKNNVVMVCIPTPDAKPPPTSVLIRVKNSEEADNLLETLNKYKA